MNPNLILDPKTNTVAYKSTHLTHGYHPKTHTHIASTNHKRRTQHRQHGNKNTKPHLGPFHRSHQRKVGHNLKRGKTKTKYFERKQNFDQPQNHTKTNTNRRHKFRKIKTPQTHNHTGFDLKICQNGHMFWTPANTNFQTKHDNRKTSSNQTSDRIRYFQAYGANFKILQDSHRTEFLSPPTSWTPHQIIKCVHKSNSYIHHSNTNQTTGQKWDPTIAWKPSVIRKVTS